MEVGTGIFLSTLVAGLVFLLSATKDRWTWKKLILWPLGVVVIIGAIVGIFFYLSDSPSPANKSELKPQTEYWGLSLGMPKDDVAFLKGAATENKAATEDEKERWSYETTSSSDKNCYVWFDDLDKVETVSCYNISFFDDLLGISRGDWVHTLTQDLGHPSRMTQHEQEDGAISRAYYYDRLNVHFILSKGKVIALGIHKNLIGKLAQ